jgi:hypothetical protein
VQSSAQVLPSAPEDQRTNNVERSWQTLSHRMCAMMLNQDNLARTCGSPSCLRRAPTTMQCATNATATPLELMCGWKPDEHYTKFHPGQLAMCPSTGHRKVLKAHFELCVTVCPCHIICPPCVLLEGQAAAGSFQEQPVGLELADLTQAEAAKLNPSSTGRQARLSASTAERIATLDSKP